MPSQSYGSYRRDRKREKRLQNLMILLQGLKALGGGLGDLMKTRAYEGAQATRAAQASAREARLGRMADIDEQKTLKEIEKLDQQLSGTYRGDFKPDYKALGQYESELRSLDELPDDPLEILRQRTSSGGYDIFSGLDKLEPGAQAFEVQRRGAEQGRAYELLGQPQYQPLLDEIYQRVKGERPQTHPFGVDEDMLKSFDQGQGKGGPMSMFSPQGEMETPQDRSMLAEFGALYRSAMNPQDPSNVLALARLNRLFNVPLPMDVQAQSQGLGGPLV